MIIQIGRIALLSFIFGLNLSFSQVPGHRLWGTLSTAGQAPGYGFIYSVNPDGSDFQPVKEFAPNPDGSVPVGGLCKISTGEIYGTTTRGGANDFGVIFRTNADGTDYTKLFDFSTKTGVSPIGRLIQVTTNGYLYGMTSNGGKNNSGTVFRIHPDGTNFSILHEFTSIDGRNPFGGLTQASDGNLYGMNSGGGISNAGTVFRITPDNNQFQKIYDFDGITDRMPWGDVIEGMDGYLYGITGAAGSPGGIFKIKKDGSDYLKLHQFGPGEPGNPQGSLTQLSNGSLIGVAHYGGAYGRGVFFSINPDGSNYTALHDFMTSIRSDLTLASDGKLYGLVDVDGGDHMVAISIETNGTGLTTMFSDNEFSSALTQRSLIEITPGVFMGVAGKGNTSNNGVVFKLTADGNFAKLKDFPQEGADPECALIHASDGDLYGVTTKGGAFGWGTIFKIKKNGTGYTTLFEFDGSNGKIPIGNLTELPGGFLYGTTLIGGLEQSGNIYKIKLDGTDFSNVKDFTLLQGHPTGNLIYASDGYLYGVTSSDYDVVKGVLYKIHPNGSGFTTVVDFDANAGVIGTKPVGIRQGSDGYLYGVTSQTGTDLGGTVYKVKTDGSGLMKLMDLNSGYGNFFTNNIPFEASDGLLYGTNQLNDFIYSIKPDGSDFKSFSHLNKINPVGDLIELPGGHIFGTSLRNIYAFEIATGTFHNLFDDSFKDYNGAFSRAGLLAVEKQSQTILFPPIITRTLTDLDFDLTATSSSGLPISFSSSNPDVAAINGSTVTITGVGSTIITARQAGSIIYGSAETVQELIVNKADQAITFNPISVKTFGEAPFDLSSSASSSLQVSYTSSNPAVASVVGKTVTIVGAGSTTLTASQPGNGTYKPAVEVSHTLEVNKKAQTISGFATIPDKTLGDEPFSVAASSSSGLTVQFSASDKVKIEDNVVTLVMAGRETVKAKQFGNTNFDVAPVIEHSFCVNPAKPVIIAGELNPEFPILTSNSPQGNQWYLNGEKISGANDITHSATESGLYTVRATVDDCVSQFSEGISLAITSAETTLKEDIQIYPIPAKDELIIEFPDQRMRNKTNVEIYDLMGRKFKIKPKGTEYYLTLDLRSLASGNYLIRLVLPYEVYHKQFVKD